MTWADIQVAPVVSSEVKRQKLHKVFLAGALERDKKHTFIMGTIYSPLGGIRPLLYIL